MENHPPARGLARGAGTPGSGEEVALTQASHSAAALEELHFLDSAASRKMSGRTLPAGRQAEAHTTE